MRFYREQRRCYCGIDLHASKMYVCVLDDQGNVVLHRNMRAEPEPLKRALAPYRASLVVGAECMFSWYWLADWCQAEGIEFVLGHALYMKAIHGGKAKNDRIDSEKIARLLRGGTFPLAFTHHEGVQQQTRLLRNSEGPPKGKRSKDFQGRNRVTSIEVANQLVFHGLPAEVERCRELVLGCLPEAARAGATYTTAGAAQYLAGTLKFTTVGGPAFRAFNRLVAQVPAVTVVLEYGDLNAGGRR